MTTPDPESRRPDLVLALSLADAAAEVILPTFRRCAVEWKPDGTEVTAADRAAEQRIREILARERPDDGILGEEFGEQPAREGNPRRWVIDPIDGTAAFALGLPMFGTLVALVEGDEPVVGVIHQPATGESTFAATGLGCWWRLAPGEEPERVRVAEAVPLADAYASTTALHSSDVRPTADQVPYRLSELARSSRRFRFVGDCIQYALVCRGRLHLAWDPVMCSWDVAAIVPCVEEAGGVVSGLDGNRDRILSARSLIASNSLALHEEAIRTLQPT